MSDSSVNPLVLIGIGSSFAFSGLFYHLYQEKKKELKKLKKIPIFRPDQHLVKVLNSTPHKRLQYVAVEGVVHADSEPLTSQFVPRCSGVIQKISVEEEWKFFNYVTKTWKSRTVNKKETNNSVPFSLVSPGSYVPDVYVRVQNPLEASGSFLERVYFRTRSAEEGVMDVVLQGLRGEKPVGMVESEEMLREGSSLTGFGEVVLEGSRVVRLQAPQDGRKFTLVPSDYRSFMDRHEATASMWKMLTAVAGITGASLVAGVIYNFTGKQDKSSK
ncbi:mitochondrial ubiquitin ligase activator of nfkb 1-A isoform X2 [Austrofundulus limnaeus]|nr:PREDICTED: mitochondrial ubiquitin ligase activator of nfkb 1-A-like isoform X2 [Austrofundulus limnaeus]